MVFYYFLVITVPVVGNFTEEEANGSTLPQDTSLEYPLQRDEVQTTPSKGERNHIPQSKYTYYMNSFYV